MQSAEPETPGTELVRELYRCFRDRDIGRLREILDPDVVWAQSPGFPNGKVRRGPDMVISGIVGAFEAEWEGWRFVPSRFLDAGKTVVVLGAYNATHRRTGRAIQAETAHVFDIADGRITALTQYSDSHTIHQASEP